MIPANSPFRQIPQNLDLKDAFFIDGMRHAAEICDFALKRLTANLLQTALFCHEERQINAFPAIFLDAWAFVDSVERYRCLHLMRSRLQAQRRDHAGTQKNINSDLIDLSNIRNIAAHIAERSDHVISRKDAALGALSWISLTSKSPMKAITCIIRPGYIGGDIRSQFSTCSGNQVFINDCTNVRLHAGGNDADLYKSYFVIEKSVKAIESELAALSSKQGRESSYPTDLFASAELDFSGNDQFDQPPARTQQK